MPHPICGKCKSGGVYSERNESGQLIICCMMCGNRSDSKAGKGFYLSDKQPLNALQSNVENESIKAIGQHESFSEVERIMIEMYQIFERMIRRMMLR